MCSHFALTPASVSRGGDAPGSRMVSMPVDSSTRTVSPSTTWTTVPRGAGVGASVGVGSEVGGVVGVAPVSAATSWSLPPATAPAATLLAPTANRAIICVAFGGDAPGVMAKLISGPVGETGPRAQPHGMEPQDQVPNAAIAPTLDCPVSAARVRGTGLVALFTRAARTGHFTRDCSLRSGHTPCGSARRSGNLRAAQPQEARPGCGTTVRKDHA